MLMIDVCNMFEVPLGEKVMRWAESEQEYYLSRLQDKNYSLTHIYSQLRASESAVENYIQLLVLLNTLATFGDDRLHPVRKNVFLDKNLGMILFFLMLTFFNMVRGHVGLVVSTKKGYVPLAGKVMLTLYYAISIFARLFAIMAMYIPLWGSFKTWDQAHKGLNDASSLIIFTMEENGISYNSGYNYSTENFTDWHWQSFQDVWSLLRFNDTGDFFLEIATTVGKQILFIIKNLISFY